MTVTGTGVTSLSAAGLTAKRAPSWYWYLVAGALLIAAYYLLGALDVPRPARIVVYCTVSTSAVGALCLGLARHRPVNRGPWLLLAISQAVYAVADIAFYVTHLLLGDERYPAPADVLYLSHYPLLIAALILLIRRRTPQWDTPSVADAAIVAVAAALLSWVFLIEPMAVAPGVPALARVASTLYPVMDLLMLVVAARLMLGAGIRTTSYYLLCASLGFIMFSDTVYAMQQLAGSYHPGNFLDATWLAGNLLLGAAALHPSMRRLDERSPVATPDATMWRLILLAIASLVAPFVLIFQADTAQRLDVHVVAAACIAIYLLVLARMTNLVRLQRLAAMTDGLTGLRTRRFFEETIAVECERAHRQNQPLGLLLLDVDHFKLVNDTYGHPGGDHVLCEVSRRLAELSRTGDVVARYGGEEFAMILPHTDGEAMEALADRVRRVFLDHPIWVTDSTRTSITVSIGVAVLPEHAVNVCDLVQRADHALYAAKNNGRNRVVSARRPRTPENEAATDQHDRPVAAPSPASAPSTATASSADSAPSTATANSGAAAS